MRPALPRCLLAALVLGMAPHADADPLTASRGARGALARSAPTVQSLADIDALVRQVVARSYPELADARIKVREVKGDDDVFFTSSFTAGSFLFRRKLTYCVRVNRDLYRARPPRAAIEAILAHELAHTAYYHARKKRHLFKLVRIFLSKKHNTSFERATDLVTIEKGYGAGLAEYRRWIYARLQGKALAKKRATYLSPEEIAFVEGARAAHPGVMAGWKSSPPKTLAAFQASLAAYAASATSSATQ